jgi:hypothetical protein
MYLSPLSILYTSGLNQCDDFITEADLDKNVNSVLNNILQFQI